MYQSYASRCRIARVLVALPAIDRKGFFVRMRLCGMLTDQTKFTVLAGSGNKSKRKLGIEIFEHRRKW